MEVLMERKQFFTSKNIAYLAVLLALVVVLQIVGTLIGRLGVTAPSLVLIPIVLGGILLGTAAGSLLGFIFGVVVIVMGATGLDGFTSILLAEQPLLTVLLCLVKGTAAGFVAGILNTVIGKKNHYAGVIVASLAAPVVNTGLFILGALLMSGTLRANFVGEGDSVLYFLVIGCAGLNFIFEFVINAVASPAICRVSEIVLRTRRRRAARREESAAAVAEHAENAENLSAAPADVRPGKPEEIFHI